MIIVGDNIGPVGFISERKYPERRLIDFLEEEDKK